MADVNYITGTNGDDNLSGGPGLNDYTGGVGDDTINATDGLNTINYQLGDGVDSVSFALPRSYQYAQFLTAATDALADSSSFSGTSYSNHYFATANQSLIDALPYEISSALSAMRQTWSGTGYVDGEGPSRGSGRVYPVGRLDQRACRQRDPVRLRDYAQRRHGSGRRYGRLRFAAEHPSAVCGRAQQ